MPGFCLGCGYSLRRLREHACPECGRSFDPADPGTFTIFGPLQSSQRRWLIAGWTATLLLCALTAALLVLKQTPIGIEWLLVALVTIYLTAPLISLMKLLARARRHPPAIRRAACLALITATFYACLLGFSAAGVSGAMLLLVFWPPAAIGGLFVIAFFLSLTPD